MNDLRKLITQILFSILALISAILAIRFLLDQFDVNRDQFLIRAIYTLSNGFVAPFENILPSSFEFPINLDAAIAAIVYITWGSIIIIFITTFFQDSTKEIIKDSTNMLFKFVESILIMRIVFDFFSFNQGASFVSMIRDMSRWSEGVISGEFFNGQLALSTFIVLIIIVIFDVLAERIIEIIYEQSSGKKE